GDAGFARVLHAVRSEERREGKDDRDRLVAAEVERLVAGAAGQRARGGAAGRAVAVRGGRALAGGGGDVARRRRDRDGVGAGRLGELVEAVGVGGGRLGDAYPGDCGAGQRARDVGDAGFARVLHAV